MKIVDVRQSEFYRYIPLKGWESVRAALWMFATGVPKGAQATTKHQIDAVAKSWSGEAFAMYIIGAPHLKGANNSFVERLLTEAQEVLRDRERWSKHYDYDGMGSFFKTSVDIGYLNRAEDMYYIGIYAAYVGDEPEVGLAEALGIPRALMSASVTVQVEKLDDRHFGFDFEPFLRLLDPVLATERISGEEVCDQMMKVDRYGESKAAIVLFDESRLKVTLSPGRVENRFVYMQPGTPTDTWKVQGSRLTGLLHRSYEDPEKFDEPTLYLSITSAEQPTSSYYSKPLYIPEEKQAALDLATRIAEALRA